jgi:hypothetical protein|tara:strand:+ start:45 stop:176 length:132 start_codon:yes stop_codon:yes gene_type:complete
MSSSIEKALVQALLGNHNTALEELNKIIVSGEKISFESSLALA